MKEEERLGGMGRTYGRLRVLFVQELGPTAVRRTRGRAHFAYREGRTALSLPIGIPPGLLQLTTTRLIACYCLLLLRWHQYINSPCPG
jgi:hypothetical protein